MATLLSAVGVPVYVLASPLVVRLVAVLNGGGGVL